MKNTEKAGKYPTLKRPVEGASAGSPETAKIEIFTTRIDTIYGASALILAPTHPLVESLIAGEEDKSAGIKASATVERQKKLAHMRQSSVKTEDLATAEKDGFFTGRYAMNPFSGERIPIWVGNFVLLEYGTGAIMAVPAHDERDNEFAVKFGLPIPIVVEGENQDKKKKGSTRPSKNESGAPGGRESQRAQRKSTEVTEKKNKMLEKRSASGVHGDGISVNSGPYRGLATADAIEKMATDAQARGLGRRRRFSGCAIGEFRGNGIGARRSR